MERIRAQIDELFASEQDLGQVLEQVARLSVRLVVQAAVEAEVSDFLGCERYARSERDRQGLSQRPSAAAAWSTSTISSRWLVPSGTIRLAVPQSG